MTAEFPSLLARILLAWSAFFRIIFDASFAARVARATAPKLEEPGRDEPADEPAGEPSSAPPKLVAPTPSESRDPAPSGADELDPGRAQALREEGACLLLAELQRGRLVDFLRQDLDGFGDEEVASAARVVHEGARKALAGCADIEPIRDEAEGKTIELSADFDKKRHKLTGNVGGKAPFRGALRHRGWHATKVALPQPIGDQHDAKVICPAEVEL